MTEFTSPDSQRTSNSKDSLHLFAPGLEKHLLQQFGNRPDSLALLRSVFAFCFANGGRESDAITRRLDESFNPRCARLPQLLISDAQIVALTPLATAMITTVPEDLTNQCVEISAELHQSAKALASIRNGSVNTLPDDLRPIALVDQIDLVRHLHNSHYTNDQKRKVLQRAREIHEIALPSISTQRLCVMLGHAISQQDRRCRE